MNHKASAATAPCHLACPPYRRRWEPASRLHGQAIDTDEGSLREVECRVVTGETHSSFAAIVAAAFHQRSLHGSSHADAFGHCPTSWRIHLSSIELTLARQGWMAIGSHKS